MFHYSPFKQTAGTASAAVVSDNLKFGLFPTGVVADTTGNYSDFAAVKTAFEDVYACLGITCAQVGALSPYNPHPKPEL